MTARDDTHAASEHEESLSVVRVYLDLAVGELRDLIAVERENGRAFGPIAEACRDELAQRCERE